jgi:hypothetical protein
MKHVEAGTISSEDQLRAIAAGEAIDTHAE